MIIIFFISLIIACEIIHEQKTIYPTEGENYKIYMNTLFKGENLTFECRGCPYGIHLQNTLNQIGKKFESKHFFKSISSNINNTNFVTITKNQQVITYGWDGDQFNIFKSYKIDQIEYHCFNVFYTLDNNVLLDCYNQNKLLLCYLQNDSLTKIYNYHSQMPKSTKIVQMVNQTQVYTLYGQYFEDYQLLTLFKDTKTNYLNISTWQQGFQDFISSQGFNRTNFIYMSNNTNLFQLIIDESEKFQILSYFILNAEIKAFTVFSSLSKNSQCDQLIVLLDLELNKNLWHFLACQKNFIQYRNYRLNINELNTQNIQIFGNDEFLIIQLDQYISIRQIDFPEKILKEAFLEKNEKINSTKFLYFDKSKNILFEFGFQLIAYLVVIPNLNGYFLNNSISQNFTIYRTIFDLIDPRCKVSLSFTLLDEKDSLIYEQFSSNPEKDYIVINKGYDQIIENYSGSLLKLTSQFSEQFVGEFETGILQKVKQDFDANFQLAAMMYVYQYHNIPQLFIVGIIEEQIVFQFCTPQLFCKNNYHENLNQTNFQQIQMAYNSLGFALISVLFESNQILLFTYDFKNFTLNSVMINIPPYQSMLLSYNCLIILTKRKEIVVLSSDLNITYHLKSDNIQQFYPEVLFFRPVAIALNQQDQSSLLVIGNENQILIFSITNSAILIPICFQKLDFLVFDIRVIKNKIIVIYNNDYLLNVCFQVWEFVNLRSLNFLQNLRCISQVQYQTSYSDNQFFYVKLNSDQIQVYNPSLPQHMSLYYSFPFNLSYLACTYVEEFSLLLINNNLYRLYPIITMRFSPNNTLYYPTYEKVVHYFYNITTGINEKAYQLTQNYTLRLINCFINITLQQFNKDIEKDEVVVLHSEILQNSSQIASYSLVSSSYEHSQCVIYNSVTNFQNITYNVIFNLLTSVNGLFVLQNNNIIQIVDEQVQSFQFNQIGVCFQSYAYYSTLYSICQNEVYQLVAISFIIYNQSIQELQNYVLQTNYTYPKQFVVLFELYFILGQLNDEANILIFNPKNNTTLILTNCKDCSYFSVTNFRNTTEASQQISVIAVFYVCSFKLYYKILNYNQNTQEIIFQTKETKVSFYKIPELQSIMPVQVLIVKNYYSEIVLLLTTSNYFTVIISITYDFSKSQFKPQQIISSIPPYGNFTLKNSYIANGILMNTYQNHSFSYHYTLYNLTQINVTNFRVPLLMFGGSPPQDYQQLNAFFYDQQTHQGQLLLFNGTQGSIYNINPMSIICNFNLSIFAKSEKFRYYLYAENAFGQNGTELIFSYSRNQDDWPYGLISIVAICLIIAIYIYLKKVKNLQPTNYDEVDEFEL